MTTMAQILVATDFSESAGHAARRAGALAREHQATLHLVHAVDDLRLHMASAVMNQQALDAEARLTESANQQLQAAANQLASQFGVQVKHELLIGRTHLQVARYAQSHAIELAVFGAHGDNAVRDLFVGSTASKFLRKGHQPTLVVRGREHQPYQRVLVAVDFSPASRLALACALRIAPQASFDVLHVSELPFEGKMRFAGISEDVISGYRQQAETDARRQLDEFLDEFLDGRDGTDNKRPDITRGDMARANLSRVVIHGSPSRTINQQAHAREADLVVMGKRGKLELDELLLGSVALRVLEEIDRDLLLVAPTEA